MDVKAFALNLASEEVLAPRNLFRWLVNKVTGGRTLPSNVYGITSLDAA